MMTPPNTANARARLLRALQGLVKPALGVLRYVLTLVLFCVIWWYDARYLNRLFDVNLALIKGASSLIDGSGKVEAMLRAFAAEKMLLFGEGSAIIWAAGKGLPYVTGRLQRWWSGKAKAKLASPSPPNQIRPRVEGRP